MNTHWMPTICKSLCLMIKPNFIMVNLKKKKFESAGGFEYQAKYEHSPIEAKCRNFKDKFGRRY